MKSYMKIAAFALGMIIPGIAFANPMVINLCTGSKTGVYYDAGREIQEQAKNSGTIQINLVETKGTIENMDRMTSGQCQAMIGQPDGPVYLKNTNPSAVNNIKKIATLHREYLQVLCNKASGVTNVADLYDNPKDKGFSINVGPVGSGAWLVWQNFISFYPGYGDVPQKNESNKSVITSVANGDTTCALFSSGVPSADVAKADSYNSDSVVLAVANDRKFDDAKDIKGEPLYEKMVLPQVYPNLQPKGWFSSTKVPTVSWLASVYINPESFSDDAFGDFVDYVNRAKGTIQSKYGK